MVPRLLNYLAVTSSCSVGALIVAVITGDLIRYFQSQRTLSRLSNVSDESLLDWVSEI